MNKRAQGKEIATIVSGLFGIMILAAFLPVIGSLFNQNCQACDCSTHQNQLAICQNQTKEIVYVNQTVDVLVEKIVERIVYKDNVISITFIYISLILSLSLTILSFKIKLPRRLEEELEKIESIITYIKFGSLVLTILTFIKLLSILLSIGK